MVQRKSIYGALVAGLLALCLLGAGCTSQPAEQQNVTATPTPEATTAAPETNATATPAPAEEYVFNETNYNETVTLPVGSEITIRAQGEDAEDALARLSELVGSGFGEEPGN